MSTDLCKLVLVQLAAWPWRAGSRAMEQGACTGANATQSFQHNSRFCTQKFTVQGDEDFSDRFLGLRSGAV